MSPVEPFGNRIAQRAAIEALSDLETEVTALVRYASRGEALVIGDSEAVEVAPRLAETGLKVQILMTGGEDQPGLPTIPQAGRSLQLHGWLGNFSVELGEPGKANHEKLGADIVLDLSTTPLLDSPLSPPGYRWANADDERSISAALLELSGLKGTFEKPKFFDYDPDICAHKRNGVEGCRACIDACPADAIASVAERIEVTPNLCQGGGACATVCPSGAIRYVYPSRQDSLKRVSTLLKTYAENGGQNPVLLVVAEGDYLDADKLADNELPLVVEELASVGLEVWLMALSLGASRVALYQGALEIPRVLDALSAQVDVANALLKAMGYPDGVVSMHKADAVSGTMPSLPASSVPNFSNKRQYAFFAADYLARHAPALQATIDLPESSPFGTIQIDKEACTLCMACTTVCPAQAVRAGGDSPRLLMHESECLQCGMCATACPETAITLIPRFVTDLDLRRRPDVLNEDEPFCCISCGKPFGSHSAINTILSKLSRHSMFQSERSLERLKMCEDCRVVDIVQDDEMMGANEFH